MKAFLCAVFAAIGVVGSAGAEWVSEGLIYRHRVLVGPVTMIYTRAQGFSGPKNTWPEFSIDCEDRPLHIEILPPGLPRHVNVKPPPEDYVARLSFDGAPQILFRLYEVNEANAGERKPSKTFMEALDRAYEGHWIGSWAAFADKDVERLLKSLNGARRLVVTFGGRDLTFDVSGFAKAFAPLKRRCFMPTGGK